MKTLFLVRHAKAENEDPSLPDLKRPLTDQGFHDARMVSEALLEQHLIPEKIISSDAIRAYTTAFVFVATFEKISGDVSLEHALYESTVKDYKNVIAGIDEALSSCMIVGHNNTISMLAIELLEKNIQGMETCGVLVIASEADTWNEFELHPRKLLFDIAPSHLP